MTSDTSDVYFEVEELMGGGSWRVVVDFDGDGPYQFVSLAAARAYIGVHYSRPEYARVVSVKTTRTLAEEGDRKEHK